MQIRTRLTLQFISIVIWIMLMSCIAIYYFSASYTEKEFYSRLENRMTTAAKLLIVVEQVDSVLLRIIHDNDAGILPQEKIIIYNYLNQTLFSTDDAQEINISTELLDKIRLDKKLKFQKDDFDCLGILYTDKLNRFVVVGAAIDKFGDSKLQNLRNILLAVIGFSVLIVLVAGWFYAGRALAPISQVVEQVDKISVSNLNLRVNEGNGQDEIARLANTFNKMLERLETAFKMQKNFVANASHELRTPLTAITGQLEVALMSKRNTEDYERAIASVLEDIKRLNDLSNRLLSLAQASSEGLENSFSKIRIDELLWQIKDELQKINPDYKVEIIFDEFPEDENKLTIKGNEHLLKIAIINIMENACKFSDDHRVVLNISFTNEKIILKFSDKGIGIEQDEIAHIFEPFYRGKNAVNTKGYGIGLSLTDRIAKLHGASIEVNSQINQGTTIIFIFS